MDTLRDLYAPRKEMNIVPVRNPRTNQTDNYFSPAVAQRWAGNYPVMDPEVRVALDLDPAPAMIFQHVPDFSYFPEHSNLDVNLM